MHSAIKRLMLWFASNEARYRYRACYLFKRNMGSFISEENTPFFSSAGKTEQNQTSADCRTANKRGWCAVLGCSQPHSTFTAQKICPAGSHSWSILSTTDICNSHTFALIYYLLTDADKCSWKPTRMMVAGECLIVEMSKIIWLNNAYIICFETSTDINNKLITVSLNY